VRERYGFVGMSEEEKAVWLKGNEDSWVLRGIEKIKYYAYYKCATQRFKSEETRNIIPR
jgi:hypothetical protein